MGNLFIQGLGGSVSWEGELTMKTLLELPNGSRPSLAGLIAITNGDALDWFENELGEKHPALKYADGEFVPVAREETPVTIDEPTKSTD